MNGAVEIQITQPGRPTGIYVQSDFDRLKLDSFYYPEEILPFDLAIVPKTLTTGGENLRALLLGTISHPPSTLVAARLLGGIVGDSNEGLAIAVPAADQLTMNLNDISDVPKPTSEEVFRYLDRISNRMEGFQWVGKEEIETLVREATIQFHQREAETRKSASSTPAWQPLDRDGRVIGYTEAEHYTEAEYTFFQLPYHFQHYVHTYLADDERILYALQRPAMRSRRHRSWLGGQKLQGGVLILTNQRLLHLVELTPPDSSGVRYGFNALLGPLERLVEASIQPIDHNVVLLRTRWLAKQSTQTIEWEFPASSQLSLDELRNFLQRFIDDSLGGFALRKACILPPPEKLPRLTDPAANQAEELDSVNQRFTALLPDLLEPGEAAHAWALWPHWFEKRGYVQILLVTDRRARIIPDPVKEIIPSLEVRFTDIATLEYVGSILGSHIGLSIVRQNGIEELSLTFPYPAERAFQTCFEALRRGMAIVPLCDCTEAAR